MKKRQWTNQQKAQIVLEGLSGQIEVSKLCSKYEIAQAQYYKWRDLFLKECHSTFEVKKQSQKEQRLEEQNAKLKRIIGDLTIELKKKKRVRAMKRRRSIKRIEQDQKHLIKIKELKKDHPLWGYRSVCSRSASMPSLRSGVRNCKLKS